MALTPRPPRGRAKAVFIDKDGTLLEDRPYNVDPARLRWSRGAAAALRRLGRAGWAVIVVTNQPGVAEGRFGLAALARLARALTRQLRRRGAALAGFHACPHGPQARCGCRKPAPGLLLRAARAHGIDLARSWMVGDILDDVEAGRRAGCRSLLLETGGEAEWRPGPLRLPHRRAPSLPAAARCILAAAPLGLMSARGAGVPRSRHGQRA